MLSHWYPCEQAGYIKLFELYKLKPCNISEVRRSIQSHEGDVHFGSGGEAMSKDLVVGDDAAILCKSHDTNEQFCIVLIDMPVHTVVSTFTDGWNQTFFEESTMRELGKILNHIT